jgi:hypothetical protein
MRSRWPSAASDVAERRKRESNSKGLAATMVMFSRPG